MMNGRLKSSKAQFSAAQPTKSIFKHHDGCTVQQLAEPQPLKAPANIMMDGWLAAAEAQSS
jgi:hypothetical protein